MREIVTFLYPSFKTAMPLPVILRDEIQDNRPLQHRPNNTDGYSLRSPGCVPGMVLRVLVRIIFLIITCVLQLRKLRFTKIELLSQVHIPYLRLVSEPHFGDLNLKHHGVIASENVTSRQQTESTRLQSAALLGIPGSLLVGPRLPFLGEGLQWLFIRKYKPNTSMSCFLFKYGGFL